MPCLAAAGSCGAVLQVIALTVQRVCCRPQMWSKQVPAGSMMQAMQSFSRLQSKRHGTMPRSLALSFVSHLEVCDTVTVCAIDSGWDSAKANL